MPEEETPFEIIDVSEVKSEDVGMLSLRYVDGAPQLVLTGGTVLPTGLPLVGSSGNVLATYTANPVQAQTRGITVVAGELGDTVYIADASNHRVR